MDDTAYTEDDARSIYLECHDDFDDDFIASIERGSRRWHDDWTYIYKRRDGTLWAVDVAVGKTEMQETEFDVPPYQVEARKELIPARTVVTYYAGDKQIG